MNETETAIGAADIGDENEIGAGHVHLSRRGMRFGTTLSHAFGIR
jgi:hypothetical protein